jgi:hypothetical protein
MSRKVSDLSDQMSCVKADACGGTAAIWSMMPKSRRLFGEHHALKQILRESLRFHLIASRSRGMEL